jgi:DNA ligase-1
VHEDNHKHPSKESQRFIMQPSHAPIALIDPQEYVTTFSTQILEAVTSKDGRKFWQGHVAHSLDGSQWVTYTTYCQTLADAEAPEADADWAQLQGKTISRITVSAPTVIEGKNIGRSNETTPKDQALFEINSTFKKQMDKGYYPLGQAEARDNFLTLPMLAYPFSDKAHKVEFPLTLQPKYDGVRCLSDGTKMWSRKGKQFSPKIVAHFFGDSHDSESKTGQVTLSDLLMNVAASAQGALATMGYITDGELILPEGYPLQDTVSAAKKFYPELSPKLLYRIYDVVAPDLCYTERYKIVQEIVAKSNHPQIIAAPVHIINSEEEMHPVHEKYVAEGWEGTMIRLHGMGYKVGQRTHQLLKLKDFLEEEFLVVGVKEGTGKFAGAAIFVCKTDEGKTFDTLPVGTMERRQYYFQNPDEVIGTHWTVRFQAWTKDRKPQFGRAINQRDEDVQG